MSRICNLFAVVVAGILVGCGGQESESSAPIASQAPAVAVSVDAAPAAANTVLLPSGGSIPAASVPPPGETVAIAAPRDPNAVIVEGSAQDPNVMPAGFVPKPPALQYVKNGEPNLEALSEALQVYCMWKKEVPADLQDLVTSKFMTSLPALPAGKKYGINSQSLTVVLVN
ncbi:MAG: hypothetical protein K0Q55_2582 [Verrucomicrobia bacterium]|jgi:hypothetical protein|nr:hypothetical protein [Verrucomicrobiota bacterium]